MSERDDSPTVEREGAPTANRWTLPKLRVALEKQESAYARLLDALEALLRLDLESLADVPAWTPPAPAAAPAKG